MYDKLLADIGKVADRGTDDAYKFMYDIQLLLLQHIKSVSMTFAIYGVMMMYKLYKFDGYGQLLQARKEQLEAAISLEFDILTIEEPELWRQLYNKYEVFKSLESVLR